MKVLIIGGVAGGATAAARLRRLDENAEIIIIERSGFVSYVLNQSGVASVGRSTAQGLFNMSTPVSRENAQPGDLIFFTGTYSAGTPVTHVGIYIGNGQMIHAGDPVQYANINTSYWTEHFYAFGRISTN